MMGLAPWHSAWNEEEALSTVMSGSLLEEEEEEGGLHVNWETLRMNGTPLAGIRNTLATH